MEQEIPMNKIKISSINVRKSGGNEDIDELITSIKKNGLLTPINVYKEDGYYYVFAGQRRYAACLELQCKTITAKIVEGKITDLEMLILSATENMVRTGMIDQDVKMICKELSDQIDGDVATISKYTGLPERIISKHLKHLNLHPYLQELRELPQEDSDYISKDLADRVQNTVKLTGKSVEHADFKNECKKWLKEMKPESNEIRNRITNSVKINPNVKPKAAAKKAKTAPTKTKITFTLGQTAAKKLDSFTDSEGYDNINEAAYELVNSSLSNKFPDEE